MQGIAPQDPDQVTTLDVSFEVGNFRLVAGVDRHRAAVREEAVKLMWDMRRNRKLELDDSQVEAQAKEAAGRELRLKEIEGRASHNVVAGEPLPHRRHARAPWQLRSTLIEHTR